jgi:hypothetical protein
MHVYSKRAISFAARIWLKKIKPIIFIEYSRHEVQTNCETLKLANCKIADPVLEDH